MKLFLTTIIALAILLPIQTNAQNTQVAYYVTDTTWSTYIHGGATATTTNTGTTFEIELNSAVSTQWAGIQPNQNTYFLNLYGNVIVEYEYFHTSGTCNLAFYNTGFAKIAGSLNLTTSSPGIVTHSFGVPTIPNAYLALNRVSGTCVGRLVIHEIRTDNDDIVLMSFNEIPDPTWLQVSEAIIEFPETLQFQNDSINYSMGIMIMIMSISTGLLIFRRQ